MALLGKIDANPAVPRIIEVLPVVGLVPKDTGVPVSIDLLLKEGPGVTMGVVRELITGVLTGKLPRCTEAV